MHVDQGIEAAVGAGEQPVDRALLVHLDMLFVEVFEEVTPNIPTNCSFQEGQILFKVLGTKCYLQKIFEAFSNIILEPFLWLNDVMMIHI